MDDLITDIYLFLMLNDEENGSGSNVTLPDSPNTPSPLLAKVGN